MMKHISLDRFLLIGGKKGHLATMDWQNKKLGCEVHVLETVRDVRYRLHVSRNKYLRYLCSLGVSLTLVSIVMSKPHGCGKHDKLVIIKRNSFSISDYTCTPQCFLLQ